MVKKIPPFCLMTIQHVASLLLIFTIQSITLQKANFTVKCIEFVVQNVTTNSVALVRKRTILTRDHSLSAKSVPTFFADRGCCVVSVTDPHGCILGILDRNRYCFFQVPLLLRKSGSLGNRTQDLWICSQEL
jgi:hypothetical protein